MTQTRSQKPFSILPFAVGSAVVHVLLFFLVLPGGVQTGLPAADGFRMISAVVVTPPPASAGESVVIPELPPAGIDAAPPEPAAAPPAAEPSAPSDAAVIGSESTGLNEARPVSPEDSVIDPDARNLLEHVMNDLFTFPEESEANAAQSSAPSEPVYLPFYQVDIQPKVLSEARLRYPEQARRQGREGVVVIEADIDELGIVRNARVAVSAGFGFDEAALEKVSSSRYSPAVAGGKPVAVRIRFTVRFILEG